MLPYHYHLSNASLLPSRHFIVECYLPCSAVMQWSSPVSLTRPLFLCDSGVIVDISQQDCLTKHYLLLKARQAQNGQCHSGLGNNVEYVQWMCKILGTVSGLTKHIDAETPDHNISSVTSFVWLSVVCVLDIKSKLAELLQIIMRLTIIKDHKVAF